MVVFATDLVVLVGGGVRCVSTDHSIFLLDDFTSVLGILFLNLARRSASNQIDNQQRGERETARELKIVIVLFMDLVFSTSIVCGASLYSDTRS